jgi:hypothetical protein
MRFYGLRLEWGVGHFRKISIMFNHGGARRILQRNNEVHLAQVITYLKLSGCKVGLLINFHVKHLRDGIKRVII